VHDQGSVGLQFYLTSIGLLLLPSKGGSMLTHTGLVQPLVHSSHDGEESLLHSLLGSRSSLSHGCSIVLLPLSDGGGLLLLS
jgi:hypothetical protein